MACVMRRLKLESAGTAKQKSLTVEPMFLLPRRFGLMFLAWLAARSGLAAQYLCLFSAVFEIHQGKNSHWPRLRDLTENFSFCKFSLGYGSQGCS